MCMKVHETNACKNFTNIRKCTLICMFYDSFQIYIWPDESLRRNQFRNGQTLDIRLLWQPKPWATTETLCYNRNLVLQPKPCDTTETLCYKRNLVLQPKPCATNETLCHNRNLVLQAEPCAAMQPKPFATNKILCFNRNLVLQPKPCATTETLCYKIQPKSFATT